MSFEDFCGFVGDHNGQWQPNLLRNTLTIHRWPMTRLDFRFSSVPDLHSPGGLEDLSYLRLR